MRIIDSIEKEILVYRMLKDKKWQNRSTNWIAKQAGTSWNYVNRMRAKLGCYGLEKLQARSGYHHPRSGKRKEIQIDD